MNSIEKQIRFLKLYAAFLTVLVGGLLLTSFQGKQKHGRFDTLQVGRINVVEPDGKLTLLISNKAQFPTSISMDGKEYPHDRDTPGILFYDGDGVECGGLIYSSKRASDGRLQQATHSLTFDRNKQDQVIALQYSEDEDRAYRAGLAFSDRPETSLAEALEKYKTREEQRQAYLNGAFGADRIYLGTWLDRSSQLTMNDSKSKERFRLQVDDTQASIVFKDEAGRVRLRLGVNDAGTPLLHFYDEAGNIANTRQGI